MIYGVTHDLDGNETIRLPKSVKVGIGCPKGKGVHVWMERATPELAAKHKVANIWKVEYVPTGSNGWKDAKVITYINSADVDANYDRIRGAAATLSYPRKLEYFTFLKPTTEGYVHDLEAIELHGPKPSSIGVLFVDDEPFESRMAMWSASELRCSGDGIQAQRVLALATAEEAVLVKEAKEAGSKFFPVMTGCATQRCPYSLPSMRGDKEQPPACKPSGDLAFQLVSNIRLGAKAFYTTTGYRTIVQLSSSIAVIKNLTGGRLAGIPFKLVVLPFKTNHNGQAATQYAVQLEVYENKEASKKLLSIIEQARDFQKLAAPVAPKAAPLALAAGSEVEDDEDERDSPQFAAAMVAEFHPEIGEDEPGTATAAETVAAKTEEKTTGLKDSIEGKKAETRTSANALKERLAKETGQAEAVKPVETVAEKAKKPFPFD